MGTSLDDDDQFGLQKEYFCYDKYNDLRLKQLRRSTFFFSVVLACGGF
jgi:hypothetical protein